MAAGLNWGLRALLMAAASSASADEAGWRVIVGPSISLPAFDTPYVSRYSPPFAFVSHTSTATQTLPLDAGTGPGVLVGVERALGGHVGLQVSAHYGEASLSGTAGHYELSLRYTSRPPPSNDPVEVGLQRSQARPPAEGRLKTLALALDVMAWTKVGSKGRLGVAAGPVWLRTKGRAERLVYTSYFLGGHSTLFSEDYLVSFDFPASTLGLGAGGFAEVDLGHRAGLRLDLRYFRGSERDAEVTLRGIVNAGEELRSADLADIERELAPPPIRVEPSFSRAALALTFRF